MEKNAFNEILLEAIRNIRVRYQQGKLLIYREEDLRCHLFFECVKEMENHEHKEPFQIRTEYPLPDSTPNPRRVDLVLGSNEVYIELKLERARPDDKDSTSFWTRKDAGDQSGSVEDDLERIKEYAASGKHAHFLLLDIHGRHTNKALEEGPITPISPEELGYWLHKYISPNPNG